MAKRASAMWSARRWVAAWPTTAVRNGPGSAHKRLHPCGRPRWPCAGWREAGRFPLPLAASNASQEMPVLQGIELAGGDGVIRIPLVTLLDQDPTGWQANQGQGRGEAFDRGGRQFGEQR